MCLVKFKESLNLLQGGYAISAYVVMSPHSLCLQGCKPGHLLSKKGKYFVQMPSVDIICQFQKSRGLDLIGDVKEVPKYNICLVM